LESNSTNDGGRGFALITAYNEVGGAQGTAMTEECIATPDISRLATEPPETLIKVYQINAPRSKIVMHQIDKLLEWKAADICQIQELATDGRGV